MHTYTFSLHRWFLQFPVPMNSNVHVSVMMLEFYLWSLIQMQNKMRKKENLGTILSLFICWPEVLAYWMNNIDLYNLCKLQDRNIQYLKQCYCIVLYKWREKLLP